MRDAFHLPGRAPIPGPRAGGSSPGGNCPPARWGNGGRRSHAAAEVLGVPHDEALQEAIDAAEAVRRRRPAGAVRRGAGFCLRPARPDAEAPGAGRLAAGEGRASCSRPGSPIPCWRSGSNGRSRCPCSPRPCSPAAAGARAAMSPTAPREQSCSPTPRRRRGRAIFRPSSAGARKGCWRPQPKLRAKGAGAALQALLDDDSLSASSKIGGQMSERGARRLFDRLVALGAIRELTGRATFRLYGL